MQRYMNETEKKLFKMRSFDSNDAINKFYSSTEGIEKGNRLCVGILMTKFDTVNNDYNISLMYGPYTYYNENSFRANLTRSQARLYDYETYDAGRNISVAQVMTAITD